MKKEVSKTLTLKDVHTLEKICNRFGKQTINEKKKLLTDFPKVLVEKVTALKEYHDCLLFMLAYPENKELYQITFLELQRLVGAVKNISEGNNETKKLQLSASGISNSTITAGFSFDLVKWMTETFPENISFHSCDADVAKQKEIFKLLLPAIEREAFEKNFSSLENWLSDAVIHSKKNMLQLLIQFLESVVMSIELRDYFYDALQIFVDIKVDDHLPSRSSARINHGDIFFHSGELIKKVNAPEIHSQKILPPLKLTHKEKEHLNTVAKCSLLMLLRETDPVTYSNVEATELHDMGRGIKIALYYLSKDRRLPVESYVGYIAFKNNIPVAYGGGWIFGNFSRIGVNVFAPFRGGESALLFSQILRLYKQRFNISVFEAEPYQIGKNNSEGIKSGAFWFYYRLSFRPSQQELFNLAEEENNKIQKDKAYRTEEKILKKLADSFMVLRDEKFSEKIISTLETSEAITKIIDENFEGNRLSFSNYSKKFVSDSLKIKLKSRSFNFDSKADTDLSAFLSLAKNLNEWSETDKQKTLQLFQLKELDSEFKYIHALQKHKKLLNELYKAVHSK
ncbi:MAG: hypothetical protein ABI723_14905 [Bacteroidia bacterium]